MAATPRQLRLHRLVSGRFGQAAVETPLVGPPPKQVAPTLKGVGMLTPTPLKAAATLESMATPLVLGDKLCIATLDGKLAVTEFDGKPRWKYDLSRPSHSSPVAAGGLLVVGCDDGFLYAFRGSTATDKSE